MPSVNSWTGGCGSSGSSSSDTETDGEHSPEILSAVVHVPPDVTADSRLP